MINDYSYASTSLIVNLAALRAGTMLANTESTITTPSQMKMPSGVKLNDIAEPIMALPTIVNKRELIGNDSMIAKTQVMKPMTSASMMTDCMMTASTAPMVRITPISLVRSSTLMLIVPVKPMLPTNAVKIAMINKKMTNVLTPWVAFARISDPDWML